MEYTNRHFRHLVRLISSRTLLYTEMVAANALAHERTDQINAYQTEHPYADAKAAQLQYDDQFMRRYLGQAVYVPPAEGASVLQLGGSDPQQMYEAGQAIVDMTDRGHCEYTAININCGCPSPKVAGKGCFGAALMEEPHLVAQLANALHEGSEGRFPVTVKCRIGTDTEQPFAQQGYAELDEATEYARLHEFISTVTSGGLVTDFSIHARIAVLQKKFSPADNRKIPPLKYHYLQKLIQDFPDLTFTLNGGIESIPAVMEQMDAIPGLSGVMVGRAWAADPWSFAMSDRLLYGDSSTPHRTRRSLLEAYGQHADAEEEHGDPIKIRRFIVNAVSPLFAGEARGKRYRIALGDIGGLPKKLHAQGKSLDGQPKLSELIMDAAVTHLSGEALDRTPEESYERVLWEETKRKTITVHGEAPLRSDSVQEWQEERKEQDPGVYEQMLASGDGRVA